MLTMLRHHVCTLICRKKLGVVHKWRHTPRAREIYIIVTTCGVGKGRGLKEVWRHTRHVCGKAQ